MDTLLLHTLAKYDKLDSKWKVDVENRILKIRVPTLVGKSTWGRKELI